ncbi:MULTISPECIES: HesA/MoeB/ThiF family protein [unclassified Paracoccus (in: a-proteobacteria)]|uniref:HesA/MoeB/ThiF family protein n=1 Tax=unclassified Paracoccus (in: a-proteobacteria) TaxID=2688777 RepID=UPI0018A6AD27|nr:MULTISPECIES: HesA/MoeB/ThiF family protein [unclassified Paracoccus (in: a-proteobacteria)]UXU75715.1 HesA/MoeB/ThiF family protein [Paracoccus sp. SMMA_5]UXU81621.1 HesA/MoeB/ThiF family protein [Paracoccus sp. SMMA_5_TC]
MSRYARQMVLPQVGAAGQDRLARARVLVVGAGGLGVPVLQYLAGAGLGSITVIDPDRVEETNLHRQPLYCMQDLGQPKAMAAARALADLNPQVRLTPLVARLTPANAPELVAASDLVLDCADSYAASYTLSDACLAAGRPLISASALGLSGYVGGFCGERARGGAPSLRALFPDPPDSGQTCASAGVMGPVVGMLGCLQAQMAMAAILGLTPNPLGQFIRLDAGRLSQFRFDGAPEQSGPRFIAREQVAAADLVIDLRPQTEAPRTAVPQALRLPDYGAHGPLPAPGQRVVLACRSGLRAWRAAHALARRFDGEITLLATGDD